ncbi:MAG: SusC/RagA family TonB-linked outer membrane protein [Bacteroidetes bacterium]|nr:SusC/RagA family TonB-linked outer membrane protein [Bacteroidota bacterium]
MKKTTTLIVMLLAFLCLHATAQERTITGKLTSADDKSGIPGVSIVVKGTTIGTTTDVDGNYKLVIPTNAKTLRFSAVGMKTKEIEIGASNNLDLVMESDVFKLDEVVVTALGISREKKALGYSTQTVTDDQLGKSGTGNVLSELSGKVSGLSVINSAGDPGSGTYMQLRGVTSLTGSNQPLIVIDGVPIDNSINNYDPTNGFGFLASGANGNSVGGTNPDNRGIDINPNDIASITVLKGPAATALYGIEAASGAIIITTKKGGGANAQPGPIVTINSSSSWSQENRLPERQNIYSQGLNGVYSGPPSGSGKKFTWGAPISTLAWDGIPTQWDPHGSIVPSAPGLTPVTAYNPYDFFVTGYTADNNIAVSGGSDKNGYRMSIGNVKQTGIVPLTGYVKTNFSLSGQSVLTKKLSASATVNYIKSETDKVQQGSNISGLMLGLLRTPTTFDNSNGLSDPANNPAAYVISPAGTERDYRGGAGYDNPYWTINRNPYHQDLDRVFGSAQADYRLYDWMTLTYRLGGDFYAQATKNGYDIHSNAFSAGAIYLVDYSNKSYNSDAIITMQRKFNKDWNASLILGHNYYANYSTNRLASGSGFAVPTWFDLGNSISFFSSESEVKIRRMAEYAQATLDYKSQLYLTLTGRNEISSTLPANNNTFFYPSASAGWVFTELPSLANNKTLPFGKLRVSYAGVGKDAPPFGTTTPYLPTHVFDGWSPGIFYPLAGEPGFSISSTTSVIGNPNLKPEHTNSFEVGVDLAFIENRISFNATYYNYKTTDGIFTVPISYTTGFASSLLNAATITNKGVELSLNLTPVKLKNGFQWDVTLNWSKNNNLVTDLAPGIDNLFISGFTNGGLYAVKGQPFGVIYGSRYVRVDPNDPNSQYLINDATGDPGMGMPIPGTKNGVIGNIQPIWIGSAVTSFTYKGFTLSGQIDIRHGGDIWNGTRGAMAYFGTGKETEDRNATKTFSGVYGHLDIQGNVVHYAANGITELPGPGGTNTTQVTLGQYYWQNIGNSFIGPTEPDVEDGSFVKLRQVSLSYNFPKKWAHKIGFYNLAMTVFANNFILQTKYSGVDPETSLVGPANGQGLDYFNNPGIKSYGFRVMIGI